jgi:hypothetical protein
VSPPGRVLDAPQGNATESNGDTKARPPRAWLRVREGFMGSGLVILRSSAAWGAVLSLLALKGAPGERCTPPYGTFRAGNWPPACYHPYGPTTWHNTLLPPAPRVDPNSAAIVAALNSHGLPLDKAVGVVKDFDHPIYWSGATDPLYRLTRCGYSGELTGASFHAPDGMLPGGGSDGHLTVIDQSTDTEWDLWRATIDDSGRTISATSCGNLSIFGDGRILTGTGRGDGGNAANTGLYAGQIRAVEIEAGVIEHPIAVVVFCTSRRYVFPASGRATSCGGPDEPADGQFFQLTYADAEIDALPIPAWKKVILHAMHRYGFYVDDTGAGSAHHPASMQLHFESDKMFRAFGYEDPFATYATAHLGEDIYVSGGAYHYRIAPGVDWSRIRAIAPCVVERTC